MPSFMCSRPRQAAKQRCSSRCRGNYRTVNRAATPPTSDTARRSRQLRLQCETSRLPRKAERCGPAPANQGRRWRGLLRSACQTAVDPPGTARQRTAASDVCDFIPTEKQDRFAPDKCFPASRQSQDLAPHSRKRRTADHAPLRLGVGTPGTSPKEWPGSAHHRDQSDRRAIVVSGELVDRAQR
jgi:hypothetical protein